MKKRMFNNSMFISLWLFSFSSLSLSQNPIISQGYTKVSEGVYMIRRYACNIAVVLGKDSLLVIDSGYNGYAFKTDSVISTISKLPIKYLLDTHFHYDHVGGNKKLSEKGAVIVAQENTKKRMLIEWNPPEMAGVKYPNLPPYTEEYLPKICFKDSLDLYFNNDIIQCVNLPNAHTDCDVIYIFKKANIIHTGDLFLSNGFPIVDIYSGGSINGYIKAVDNVIKRCDEKTILVPGHGSISNRQGLIDYRDMLFKSRNNIEKLVKEGKTLDEVIAADPTKDLYKGGKSWLAPKVFVYTVYQELLNK
jgi:cyclase